MLLVDMKTPGVNILRPLSVFGSKDSPHGHAEVEFKSVRVPASNMLLGKDHNICFNSVLQYYSRFHTFIFMITV